MDKADFKLYVSFTYAEIENRLKDNPNHPAKVTLDQAAKIKAIMDRAAQEMKKVTGVNPKQLQSNINGIVFVREYKADQQILVENVQSNLPELRK